MSTPSAVLFDLDGTLLPMDQDEFAGRYFALLAQKMAAYGYEPRQLTKAVWQGTAAMAGNDGTRTNEEAFWAVLRGIYGERVSGDLPVFERFYTEEFGQAQQCCGFQPLAAGAVRLARRRGCRVALATNPIFPAVATRARIGWAGLTPEDFDCVTTYETARYCKPNPAYFREVAGALGVRPEDCLMIGNDATEDLAAAGLGMRVFLVTDCLINREEKDLSACPHGSFAELREWMEATL